MLDPRRLAAVVDSGAPAAVCTVVCTKGSTPRKAGATMLVVDDGTDFGAIEGTVGGGAIEHEIRRQALEVIATMRPRLVEIPLTTVLGMCCGGSVSVFIESLRTRPPCVLFGAGHVGAVLCTLATKAGFDVTVVDPRDELRERCTDAVDLRDSYDHDDDYAGLPFANDCFVVVATHDHAGDQRIVEKVLTRSFAFLALVGSQRKALLTRERLANKGFDDDVIASLRCPAGLDIGAETPEEIALSVVAQMVQVRRQAESALRSTKATPLRKTTG
ncbi:MAG: XdhC family protein [Deltaproteobacteria bacterium]|nr:XdhC family protein [Deltaproteobacteria bacterium]